jgi:hypothetical protein
LYKALKISAHLPLYSLSFALLVILKMDEHRHKVLEALVFFMAIRHVMVVVVILQQLALHQHYGAMTMMVVVMVGGVELERRHGVFEWLIRGPILWRGNYWGVIRHMHSSNIQGYFRRLLSICVMY